MKGIVSVLAILLLSWRVHCVGFEDCSVNGEIFSLEINDCVTPPCKLVIGGTANMTLKFRTAIPAISLKERAYFMISEVEQEALIQPNACNALVGASCPLGNGDTAVYKAQAIITNEYPPMRGDFVWMLKNEQENIIICFAVGVRLGYNYNML